MRKHVVVLLGFVLLMDLVLTDTADALDPNLVGCWMLDDGSGTTALDSSDFGNDGTLVDNPRWVTGQINGALQFDGDGDYVEVDAITALAGDTLTVQAWIRVDEFAGPWNPVLMQRDSKGNGYYFYISYDRPSFYVIGDDGANFAQTISPETINADQWYPPPYSR